MNSWITKVKEFHKKYDAIPVRDTPGIEVDPKLAKLRIRLLSEEVKEVIEEIEKGNDAPALAKELSDLLFVLLGTVVTYGMADIFSDIFDEVYQSNMSKDFDPSGKPKKGGTYRKANIEKFFRI